MSSRLPFVQCAQIGHDRSSSMITSFSNTPSSASSLAVATAEPELVLLNTMTATPIRQSSTPSVITNLHLSHSLLVSGSADGYIRTHDMRTAMVKEEGSAPAHSSGIQGLVSSGNFVYSIGWGMRFGPHSRRCSPSKAFTKSLASSTGSVRESL